MLLVFSFVNAVKCKFGAAHKSIDHGDVKRGLIGDYASDFVVNYVKLSPKNENGRTELWCNPFQGFVVPVRICQNVAYFQLVDTSAGQLQAKKVSNRWLKPQNLLYSSYTRETSFCRNLACDTALERKFFELFRENKIFQIFGVFAAFWLWSTFAKICKILQFLCLMFAFSVPFVCSHWIRLHVDLTLFFWVLIKIQILVGDLWFLTFC